MPYNELKVIGVMWFLALVVVVPSSGQSVLNYTTPAVKGPIQKIKMEVYTNSVYDAVGKLKTGPLNSCLIYEYDDGLPSMAHMYSGGGAEPGNLTSKFEYSYKKGKLVQVNEFIRKNYFSKSSEVSLQKKSYLHYNDQLLSHEIVEDAAGSLIARYDYCQSLQKNENPLYEWVNKASNKKSIYGIRYRNGIVDLNYAIVGMDTTFIKNGVEIEEGKWDFTIKRNNKTKAVEYTEIIHRKDKYGNIQRVVRIPKDINQKIVVIEYTYFFEQGLIKQ